MKRRQLLVAVLAFLLAFLQVRLWIGHGGLQKLHHLDQENAIFERGVTRTEQKNQELAAEVDNLQHGGQAIEEQARSELGMIGKGETFYLVVHGS